MFSGSPRWHQQAWWLARDGPCKQPWSTRTANLNPLNSGLLPRILAPEKDTPVYPLPPSSEHGAVPLLT